MLMSDILRSVGYRSGEDLFYVGPSEQNSAVLNRSTRRSHKTACTPVEPATTEPCLASTHMTDHHSHRVFQVFQAIEIYSCSV